MNDLDRYISELIGEEEPVPGLEWCAPCMRLSVTEDPESGVWTCSCCGREI